MSISSQAVSLENCPARQSKTHRLTLFPNLQFIYELHLAHLESSVLARDVSAGETYRYFSSGEIPDLERFSRRTAYIAAVDGKTTDYPRLTKKNVTRAFNQYVTHWFYPYKGKYHPQMVRALANIIGLELGETLLDPFVGSGTTVVEGALLGLKTIGFDISPLCALISSVKANALHDLWALEQEIQKESSVLKLGEENPLTLNLAIQQTLSDPVESFKLLARMIAKSDESRRRRDYSERVGYNTNRMLKSIQLMKEGCEEIDISPPPAQVKIADARNLPLKTNSVDGVITSPPYSIALNYVENDAHSLEVLGYDLNRIKEEFIGVRGSGFGRFDLYEQDMDKAYSEIARVLKPGRKAAVVLGNVTYQEQEINTVGNCVSHFRNHGLCLTTKIEKLIYGLYNIMQREWILIFEKAL